MTETGGRSANARPANPEAHVALRALILFFGTGSLRGWLSGTPLVRLCNLLTILKKIPISRRPLPPLFLVSLSLSFFSISLLSFNHFLTQGCQRPKRKVCQKCLHYSETVFYSKHNILHIIIDSEIQVVYPQLSYKIFGINRRPKILCI